MKHILLFGAGKSATVLIDYLKTIATEKNWKVTVADNDVEAAQLKVGEHELVKAVQLNITNDAERKQLIAQADIVISMMPPSLHYLVALDCIEFKKHLLTASYVDERIKNSASKIKNDGLLFLCEMGLDPGIDHMSAMQIIHRIKNDGGKIISFKSHCGGLVAPESDNNPWHYKISWNPRNVVLAGKAGAIYKEQNKTVEKKYHDLFQQCPQVKINGLGNLAYYPNRDSLSYIPLYQLEEAETFIRTTLRYPSFCDGWKYIVDLKLTDEEKKYQTNGISFHQFFKQYFSEHHVQNILMEASKKEDVIIQLKYFGLFDDELINANECSAADVLQILLEKKLVLQKTDKDMIVMLHEFEYEVDGKQKTINSSLIVKGDDSLRTAMAKTVGLPLGIAAKLILEQKITEAGLHIPVVPNIYEPVLNELQKFEIKFIES
ncbi:MAG TPA: saccharopine dehydrogenase C-terminal domain-containing protein [Chitinophagaceae bacterium]|nr:saccharopine dehydrogenase C-terminal domain-containing protein [Chitinophagaceae bacterium]